MVTALLVSHGGARWLPAVLDGLASQSQPVDRTVAVDTGRDADTLQQLAASPVIDRVVEAPRDTPFGTAVRDGLAALEPAGEDEWVWILHDDATPAHDALEQLLATAEQHPEAVVLGPKLREWPSLRRLLELGVTISGTGRRETGLERGEYDQGQHDEVRRVLAVNTAGMLVRRRVLDELDGFDDELPVFGNDLDFGWRAARAGHTTVVAPAAVVFHAEAAHRGLRRTPLTGRHTHYQERRAALWTLLANTPGWRAPLLAVRLVIGSVLRALGLLLIRSVGPAMDELAALGAVLGRPGRLLAARRVRRERASVADREVRPLLPRWWVPYRHGLDAVVDFGTALTGQAQDVAERRRAAALRSDLGTPTRPERERRELLDDEDELAPDSGWLVALLTSPVAIGLTVFLVLVAIATRDAWGAVSGGALPPAPAGVGDWWRLHTEDWHPIELGSDVAAPAYLPVLAGLGLLLGGSAQAAVGVLMVLSFPVALWGAWRLLRVAGHLATPLGAPRWLLGWGAMTYALVPAVSGAWGEGRYGVVAAAALLPWLAHAGLGLADPEADRRWRAGWRTGVLLAVVTAFAPVAWPLAVLLVVVLLAAGAALARDAVWQRSVVGPVLAALGTSAALLLPWWLPLLVRGHAGGLLLDPGLLPVASLDSLDLVTGVVGDLAAPFWPGLVVALLAVAALVPVATRIPVLVCWLVALVAAVAALLLSVVELPLGGGTTRPGLALVAVLLQGLAVVAVVIAGAAPSRRLVRGSAPRVAGAIAGVALLLVPLSGLVWFAAFADDELGPTGDQGIPAYMEQSADLGPQHGIVVLSGSLADGLDYVVRRGDGPTVGEPEIAALTAPEPRLTETMGALLSRPTPAVARSLAGEGIEYVVLSSPADPRVAAVLDTAPGLVRAGTADRTMRAWQVTAPLSAESLAAPGSSYRVVLVIVQGLALVVALVLCAPSRREAA
ncbi:glycosyltransferase family 2 protein [Nocardioides rotundus]|uniref:glycosyltransferase family 2 protein n=1 Tax=Nocardioides rotundus TaxID=1774216 RepID=UPI001CBFEABF|nr:glycosyltransferase family 2 protein [Nocardioides rotundus]UAL28624.1 glycosyltransferase family 2 protein [Nocardioides rotundus]